MSYWTIIAKEEATEAEARAKSFTVMVDMDKMTWEAFGSNREYFVSIKKGKCLFHTKGANVLQLGNSKNECLATFKWLTKTCKVGAEGVGETESVHITWVLDSK